MWVMWCLGIYGRFAQGLVLQTPAVLSQHVANDSEPTGFATSFRQKSSY